MFCRDKRFPVVASDHIKSTCSSNYKSWPRPAEEGVTWVRSAYQVWGSLQIILYSVTGSRVWSVTGILIEHVCLCPVWRMTRAFRCMSLHRRDCSACHLPWEKTSKDVLPSLAISLSRNIFPPLWSFIKLFCFLLCVSLQVKALPSPLRLEWKIQLTVPFIILTDKLRDNQ